jgi:hypothetical protein
MWKVWTESWLSVWSGDEGMRNGDGAGKAELPGR